MAEVENAGTEGASEQPVAQTPVTPVTPVTPETPEAKGPTWGDDWRERIAGKDEAMLKHLGRYATLENYAKAGFQAQQKLRSGEYKRATIPQDPDELVAWRKEVGVPESPDKYAINPPEGVVFGEDDKPTIEDFAKFAHANNWTRDQLNQALAWYGQHQERVLGEMAQKDDQFKLEATEALKDLWPGQDYYKNRNVIKSLVGQLSPEFQDLFQYGRTADGRLMGDHPTVLAAFAQIARMAAIDADYTVGPTGDAAIKADGSRIAEIEKMMRTDRNAYNRDENIQNEYRTLLERQERAKGRAA